MTSRPRWPGPAGRWPSSGSAASRRTSRSCKGVLDDPDFTAGGVTTSFIETHPELLTARASADRGTKLLTYLADVTVNRPYGEPRASLEPGDQAARRSTGRPPPRPGSRDLLRELGPEAFAARLRSETQVRVTDTTFRDAHQSLLATRVRTRDLVAVAGHVARLTPQLWSVEAWGGATYDVALRFLAEDPWERLAALREAMPNLCLQMLLRGRNTVGYTPYPVEVTDAFVAEAARTGVDVFRIFDALNDIEQMRPAIDAVRATGTAVAEVALCYTGDLSDPGERLYTLDYYLRLAERIVEAGAHVLAIKDMAGLLRAPAARTLVTALRERFDLPVHLHTHDTAGGQLATLLAAIEAGVDAVDAASAPMSGTTSQPSMTALVAATDHGPRETGLDLGAVMSPRAVLGGGPAALRAVRVRRCPRRPAGSTCTRSPAASCPTCASRPSPSGSARSSSRSRTCTPPPTASSATSSRSRRAARSSATWPCTSSRSAPTRREFAAGPGPVRHPRLGHRLPVRRARRPARRLARAVPHQGARRPDGTHARGEAHATQDRAALDAHPRAALNRLLFPGPTRELADSQAQYGDLTVLPHAGVPLRPAARGGARDRARRGRPAVRRRSRRSASRTSAACAR